MCVCVYYIYYSYIVLLVFTLRSDHHSLPRAYVTCHPHPSVPKLTTPISVETTDPHWEYPCVTHVPSSFLETGLCELEFQVWSLPSLPSGTTEDLISGTCA